MADLMADGEAWLAAQLKAQASREVTYRRGGESVTLLATVGQTRREKDDVNDGSLVRYALRDYLILAEDLDFGSGPITPARGDTIEETLAGETRTFAVAAGQSGDVWDWSGRSGILLRIHTEEID